jgi:phospholipid-binding lipoprotein MlaA
MMITFVRQLRLLGALAAVAALAGCAATPSKVDPLEPMNRGLYQFHDAIDTAVLKPVAETYVATVHPLVRTGVSNFFQNIDDFFSAVNGALQGKPDKAGNDLGRVMLNTGFGLGGIFDLASMIGIERGEEDFGQTFGVWGFPQGPYLFIPLIGPSSFRDGTGLVVRWAVGPIGYIDDLAVRYSLYALQGVDARARLLETSSLVEQAALDKYVFIRNAYLQRRRYLLYDGKPPPETEE